MRDTESQNTVKFEFEHFLLQRIFRSMRSEQNKTRPNLYERKLIGAKCQGTKAGMMETGSFVVL